MKRFIITIGILAGLLLALAVANASTLQDYFNTGDDNYAGAFGTSWITQTFTTNSAYTITETHAKLYREGSPGTCNLNIYATTSDHPTGSAIASGSFNGNALTTNTAGEWITVTYTGTALTSTTKYAIVLNCPDGTNPNRVNWRMDASSPSYSGGSYGASADSGANWSMNTSYDHMFETYSGVAATSSDPYILPDTLTRVVNPTQDLFNGILLFFGAFFGIIIALIRKGVKQ